MNHAQRAIAAATTVPLLFAATTMWRAEGTFDAWHLVLGAAMVIPPMIAIGRWALSRCASDPDSLPQPWLDAFEPPLEAFGALRGLVRAPMASVVCELRGVVEGVSITVRPYVSCDGGQALVEIVAQVRPSAERVAVRRQWALGPDDPASGLPRVKTGDREFDREFKTHADPPGGALAVLDTVTRAILRNGHPSLQAFDNDRDVLRVQMKWSKATKGPPLAEIETALRLTTVLAHRRAAMA